MLQLLSHLHHLGLLVLVDIFISQVALILGQLLEDCL